MPNKITPADLREPSTLRAVEHLITAPTGKAGVSGMRMWTIPRTRAMSAYGASVINDKQFQHAISVGTRAYNEQNKALDRR